MRERLERGSAVRDAGLQAAPGSARRSGTLPAREAPGIYSGVDVSAEPRRAGRSPT